MRSDIPAEEAAKLARELERLPADLRATVEAAIDARYPSVEQETEERREREKQHRKEDAEHHRELAAKVERALGGEWGDDVRREVDEATREVRHSILVLADWAKRARKHDPLTKIEWASVRAAVEARAVRYALAAATKIIVKVARERRTP